MSDPSSSSSFLSLSQKIIMPTLTKYVNSNFIKSFTFNKKDAIVCSIITATASLAVFTYIKFTGEDPRIYLENGDNISQRIYQLASQSAAYQEFTEEEAEFFYKLSSVTSQNNSVCRLLSNETDIANLICVFTNYGATYHDYEKERGPLTDLQADTFFWNDFVNYVPGHTAITIENIFKVAPIEVVPFKFMYEIISGKGIVFPVLYHFLHILARTAVDRVDFRIPLAKCGIYKVMVNFLESEKSTTPTFFPIRLAVTLISIQVAKAKPLFIFNQKDVFEMAQKLEPKSLISRLAYNNYSLDHYSKPTIYLLDFAVNVFGYGMGFVRLPTFIYYSYLIQASHENFTDLFYFNRDSLWSRTLGLTTLVSGHFIIYYLTIRPNSLKSLLFNLTSLTSILCLTLELSQRETNAIVESTSYDGYKKDLTRKTHNFYNFPTNDLELKNIDVKEQQQQE